MNSLDDQDQPARNQRVTGAEGCLLLKACPATEWFAGDNNDSVAFPEDSGLLVNQSDYVILPRFVGLS